MNTYLRKSLGGAIFTLLLIVGATMATSVTAQAQYPQYPANRDWQYRREQRERAERERVERERREDRYRRNNSYGNTGVYNRNGSYGTYGYGDRKSTRLNSSH